MDERKIELLISKDFREAMDAVTEFLSDSLGDMPTEVVATVLAAHAITQLERIGYEKDEIGDHLLHMIHTPAPQSAPKS